MGEDFVDVTRKGRVRPDATNRGTRGRHKDDAQTATIPRRLCPSTQMRAYMLDCAGIIAQPIEAHANKKSLSTTMQGNYAGFAQSVVAVVARFVRPALAGS